MATIAAFLTNWRKAHAALEVDAEWLGSAGWTIPLWADPRLVKRLRQAPGDLDDAFVRHYTKQGGTNLRTLWEELAASRGMRPWRTLITESVASYEDRRYAIVVPALLSVVEGAVAKAGRSLKQQPRPKTDTRRMRSATDAGMRRLMWVSIEGFVKSVFGDAPFQSARPVILNRHWVLHGRTSTRWARRRECIRLFHALGTIAPTVDHVR